MLRGKVRPTITIDTNLWLNWFDHLRGIAPNAHAGAKGIQLEQLIWASISGIVSVWASNRVLCADVDLEDRGPLRSFLSAGRVRIAGSSVRIGMSPIGGLDALRGRATTRSPSEIAQFRAIAGHEPASRHGFIEHKRLTNKIGDYDSLFDHFCERRDVFITEDRGAPFNPQRRTRFEKELGLLIQSLGEFMSAHAALFA